jgi:protein-disulfide isomerase
MISPKYAGTHYFVSSLKANTVPPHVVNLYLDFNCIFSAKLYGKLYNEVIPRLQKEQPDKFQFVFVQVIQPWHPPSVLINEFAVYVAKLLRDHNVENSNKLFWELAKVIFENKENVWDSTTAELTRNQTYGHFYDFISKHLKLPFSKEIVLKGLQIETAGAPTNNGNEATNDLKYFTKYLRGVGVHVTPTVSVDGIVVPSIESSTEVDELISIFKSHL